MRRRFVWSAYFPFLHFFHTLRHKSKRFIACISISDFPRRHMNLFLEPLIQQWPHIVNAQVVTTALCDRNRNPRLPPKARHVCGDALPVVFTHMNRAVLGRRKSAGFCQFSEFGGFGRAERRACFFAFEIPNNRRQQKHTPNKRLHLGLCVEEQVATKRVAQYPRLGMPEMLLQILLNLTDLVVKSQRLELPTSLPTCDIKTSVPKALTQSRRQLTTKARKVVNKITHTFACFESYLITAISPRATTTPKILKIMALAKTGQTQSHLLGFFAQ